jgi:hypothetical protein
MGVMASDAIARLATSAEDGAAGSLTAAALLVLTAPVVADMGAPAVVAVTLFLVAFGVVMVGLRPSPLPRPRSDFLPATSWVLGAVVLFAGLQWTSVVGVSSPGLWLLELLLFVAVIVTTVLLPNRAIVGGVTTTRVMVAGQIILLAFVLYSVGPGRVDVWVFLSNGAHALLHGANPYRITIPDIYTPAQTKLFYGHGVVVNHRVNYGFPYLPLSVLLAVPGYLLGDVRFASAISLGALAWVWSGRSATERSRAYAVLLLLSPSTLPMLRGSWSDVSSVVTLGFAVWAMKTGRLTWAAVLTGLFLVSKQYVIVTLPCLWLLRPLATRRRVAIALGTAATITLPFVIAAPHAFWRSAVRLLFVQPFRRDSLSLLVLSVNHTGWPGPAVYGVLPLAAGLVVALLFALKVRPGPAQYATGVALSLLTTVLLSKQAFLNYYFFIGGALLIAGWAASESATSADVRPVPEVSAGVLHRVLRLPANA